MAELRFDQSNFSEGELDPRLQARTDYTGYVRGAKYIRNNIVIPQGGVQRRWGTTYVDKLQGTTASQYCEISTLLYDDSSIYLLLWEGTSLKIYLENVLVATVVTTYQKEDIQDLRFAQINNDLVICNPNFTPRRLVRSANAGNAITGINSTNMYINVTSALTVGTVYPVQFTTVGSLPVTSPQIYTGRTYFIKPVTTTSVRVYATSEDAINGTNFFTVTSTGTGNVVLQNTWTLSDITFKFTPGFDFNSGYSGSTFTFTPGATSGTPAATITLTASSPIFNSGFVGGYFTGNGGVFKITAYTSTTVVNGYTVVSFTNVSAIPGALSYLAEPAWSATRGWPRTVAFFQNRLVFGGTSALPNGVWLSSINDVLDFDDSEGTAADDAISWYPAAGSISYIRSITSARSLLVHTNTGVFATPLTSDLPLTPTNFTLTEQNKIGANNIQPVFIDNQLIYIDKSGNNVRQMSWEIVQSSYMDSSTSISASSLINEPVDMAAFSSPTFVDGSYVLIVNSDGTVAVWQSLLEQNIKAWSLTDTKQTSTSGSFVKVANGSFRIWFVVQRTINSSTVFYIEEIDFSVYTDCSKKYTNVGGTTLTGLSFLNGESVQILADGGIVSPITVSAGSVTLPNSVTNVNVGLGFTSKLTPLPLNNLLANGGNFYQPKHVRSFYINYYKTIGGTIQGSPFANPNLQDVVLNQAPSEQTGVWRYTLMEGWGPFDYEIDIVQDQPAPMTILAVGYVLESS